MSWLRDLGPHSASVGLGSPRGLGGLQSTVEGFPCFSFASS